MKHRQNVRAEAFRLSAVSFLRMYGRWQACVGGLALLLLCATTAQAGEFIANPLRVAQPDNAPAQAMVLVEIPAGSFTKYETRTDGLIAVDRFQSMPVAYPANYGSMPSTLAADGDPLDALVLTREPLYPGVLINFRPIAVLHMIDKGRSDEKIIGVPIDKVDPTYMGIRDLADLSEMERQRIEAFFRIYKDLPAGRNAVQLNGWGGAVEAKDVIVKALTRFKDVEKEK